MFVLEVIYATAIFFSNPINLFPVYESLYKLKRLDKYLEGASSRKKFWTKFFIRVTIVLLCFITCLLVPSFINFISFVGSFLFGIIGLYIPVS